MLAARPFCRIARPEAVFPHEIFVILGSPSRLGLCRAFAVHILQEIRLDSAREGFARGAKEGDRDV
jgi:hypothetical protein